MQVQCCTLGNGCCTLAGPLTPSLSLPILGLITMQLVGVIALNVPDWMRIRDKHFFICFVSFRQPAETKSKTYTHTQERRRHQIRKRPLSGEVNTKKTCLLVPSSDTQRESHIRKRSRNLKRREKSSSWSLSQRTTAFRNKIVSLLLCLLDFQSI